MVTPRQQPPARTASLAAVEDRSHAAVHNVDCVDGASRDYGWWPKTRGLLDGDDGGADKLGVLLVITTRGHLDTGGDAFGLGPRQVKHLSDFPAWWGDTALESCGGEPL